VPDVDGIRGLFRGLAISASGMSAQSRRMDVIAMNIANAETTRTPEGGPYRRRVLELRAAGSLEAGEFATRTGERGGVGVPDVPDVPPAGSFPDSMEASFGVETAGLSTPDTDGPLVYEPGHPDADDSGYVRYPNVEIAREMIDLMETRRAYEANATVFEAMKSMLQRAARI